MKRKKLHQLQVLSRCRNKEVSISDGPYHPCLCNCPTENMHPLRTPPPLITVLVEKHGHDRLCGDGKCNLTFDGHMYTLAGGELRLNQHVACVLSLIHFLLHVGEFQSAIVLKCHLAMVERKQIGVLVPFDGVIGIANHTAVDVCVPPCYCCDIFHWSNACRP